MPDTIERAVYELDSSGYVKGADAATQATDRLTVAERKQEKAKRESAEAIEKWIRSADRQLRVYNQFKVDLDRLARYEREEVGTAQQRARALDMVTEKYIKNARAAEEAASGISKLRAKFDPATTSAKTMNEELGELNKAFRLGINIAGGYTNKYNEIIAKYNEGSAEAKAARAAQLELNNTLQGFRDELDATLPVLRAYEAELEALAALEKAGKLEPGEKRVIEKHIDDKFTGRYRQASGQDEADRKAAAEQDRLNAALEKTLDLVDPTRAATRRYNAALAELDELLGKTDLSAEQARIAHEKLTAAYDKEIAALRGLSAAEMEAQAHRDKNAITRAGSNLTGAAVTVGRDGALHTKSPSFFDILDKGDRTGAPTSGNSALGDRADEQDRLNAATEKYLRLIDPTREATEKYNAALAEINELEAKGEISALGRAVAEDRLTAAYEKEVRVLSGLAEAERKAAAAKKESEAAAAKAAAEHAKLVDRAQQLREQANPQRRVDRTYREALNEVKDLVDKGHLGGGDAATITSALAREYDTLSEKTSKAAAASREHEKGMLGNTQQSRAMQFALTNLSFQINDVATSLSSGAHFSQVFAQQAGQFVQVFTQGGGVTAVLTEFVETIKKMATPLNAALGLLALLAIGFGVAIAKALEAEGRIRAFNVALQGMGTQGLASATGFENSVKQLREFGLAADDANKALLKVARARDINPARRVDIVETGANLGAIRGTDALSGTEEIIKALQDGPEALIEIGVELRKLEPEEIKEIRRLDRLYGSVVAVDKAYALLSGRIGGAYQSSLSEAAKAWIEFKNAIDDFFRDAGVGSAVRLLIDELKGVLQGLKDTITEIKNIIDAAKAAKDWVAQKMGDVTAGGDRATQAAVAARNEMSDALAARDRAAGGTGLVVGSARFDTSKFNANTQALQELTAVLSEASRELPAGHSLRQTSGLREGDPGYHGAGKALDVQIIGPGGVALPNKGPIGSDPGLYKDLAVAAYRANQRLFPGTELTWGQEFETKVGSKLEDWMHFDRGPHRGRLGPGLASIAGPDPEGSGLARSSGVMTEAAKNSVLALTDQNNKLEENQRKNREAAANQRLFADAQVYAEARTAALAEAEQKGYKGTAALTYANQEAAAAVEKVAIERDKASIITEREISSQERVAEAFKNSSAAGYRAAAEEEARNEVFQHGGDVALRTRQILDTAAVAAIRVGREQVAAQNPVLANQQKLLDATIKGTEAAQDQEIANAASARTQDALNRAIGDGKPLYEAQAKAVYEAALAQEKLSAEQKAGLQAAQEINQNRRTLRSTALETGLTASGLPQDAITRQLDYLAAVEKLNTELLKAPPEIRDAYAATAVAVADAKYQLQQVQREQERWNDLVRDLIGSIQNELTQSIQDAFSEEKVESWGKRLQKWIGSAASQLSSSLFIKPALGTLAGTLGFGTVAQSLGSFGSLGGGGSLFGGGGSGGTGQSAVITQQADGKFSLQTLSSGASLANSSWNLLGGGSTGTLGFLDTIGEWAGFSTPLQGPTLSGAPLGAGSLFSSSFGSFLGGAGAGLGAGLTLNSLLGGNKLGGSVGSATGALAGALLGAAIPVVGPFIGGIVGGAAGGGLGGLFGQSHKRANAAGLSIDLSTGAVSGSTSSGSPENAKTARTLSDSIAEFTKSIQEQTKGTAAGYINPQATDQGIKLDYNIPGFGAGEYTTQDSQDAIDKAELAIARGLTGISATMKTVIDQVTDPAKLQDAIDFADTYTKIADAAKDAFSSIPSDLDVTGPFAKAKDDLKDIFDAIAADTKKFGLDMQPVTDALAEANRRLTKDFDRYIQDLITAAEDPMQSLVDIEKRAGDERVADAKAVNGNILQVNKYNAMALDKIWKDSTQSIVDFQKDLKYGESSGLTSVQRLKQSQADYDALLVDVKSGKTAKFEDFVTSGKSLYSLYTQAYGQGPQTAGLRTDILKAIDDVLATRSFAKGGTAGSGWNRFGERGAEWVYTPSPSLVLPHGQSPAGSSVDMSEVCSLLGDVVDELRANSEITRIGHGETVERLDGIAAEAGKPAPYEPRRRQVANA